MAKASGSTKKGAGDAAGGVTFDVLRPLFGKAIDDPEVVAVLERVGAKFGKPSDGSSYAVAKKAGFDLLARRPPDSKRGGPYLVRTAFLYREGQSKHKQFPAPPYGLAFTTRAEVLATMPPPQRTWLIGKGEVPVSSPKASHDRSLIDGLYVSSDYHLEGAVRSIDISLPDE
jgi:hypothetical protein